MSPNDKCTKHIYAPEQNLEVRLRPERRVRVNFPRFRVRDGLFLLFRRIALSP